MWVVTYTAFVRNIRCMIALFAAPLLFLLGMTFVAQLWNRVFDRILWFRLGIVASEATPDETGPVNKWIGGDPPVTRVAGGFGGYNRLVF